MSNAVLKTLKVLEVETNVVIELDLIRLPLNKSNFWGLGKDPFEFQLLHGTEEVTSFPVWDYNSGEIFRSSEFSYDDIPFPIFDALNTEFLQETFDDHFDEGVYEIKSIDDVYAELAEIPDNTR